MAGEQVDTVAGADVTFDRDAQVIARASCRQESPHHAGVLEVNPELVARQPRLRDHEFGRADAEPVAHRGLLLERCALDRQVLAERAPRKAPAELVLPERVVLHRVGVDRLVGAAVHRQVGLAVAVEVHAGCTDAPFDRLLQDPGRHRFTPPRRRARQADVQRDDARDRAHRSIGVEPSTAGSDIAATVHREHRGVVPGNAQGDVRDQLAQRRPELEGMARAAAGDDQRPVGVDHEVGVGRHRPRVALALEHRRGRARKPAPHPLGQLTLLDRVRLPDRRGAAPRLRPGGVERELVAHAGHRVAVDAAAALLHRPVRDPGPADERGDVEVRDLGDRRGQRQVDPERLQQLGRPRAGRDHHHARPQRPRPRS